MIRHDFDDNKYTVIFTDNGHMEALRYGEKWRDLTGDGLVLAMLQDYDFLKEQYVLEDLQVTSLLNEVESLKDQLEKLKESYRLSVLENSSIIEAAIGLEKEIDDLKEQNNLLNQEVDSLYDTLAGGPV